MLMDLLIVLMAIAGLTLTMCIGEWLRVNITRLYRLIHIRQLKKH